MPSKVDLHFLTYKKNVSDVLYTTYVVYNIDLFC